MSSYEIRKKYEITKPLSYFRPSYAVALLQRMNRKFVFRREFISIA